MTLPARLRAHDPSAIREVYDAIIASRGVLAEVGRLLGCRGNATAASGRLVARAGLEEQLAAVQQEHGTGRSGRPVRRLADLAIAVPAASLPLSAKARARYVTPQGRATALLVVDEEGKITGHLAEVGARKITRGKVP